MVHINAWYYGEAIKPKDGDEMGEVALGNEDVDLAGAGTAELGKISVKTKDLAKVKGHTTTLLINVYTSRKKFENNLFDCGIFQDLVTVAAKAPIAISCKMIGE